MFTLCIIMVFAIAAITIKVMDKTLDKLRTPFAYLALATIMVLPCVYGVALYHQSIIGDATAIIKAHNEKGASAQIYYDEELDKYFRIDEKIWVPYKFYERTYLDSQDVERYVEYKEMLNSIDLVE